MAEKATAQPDGQAQDALVERTERLVRLYESLASAAADADGTVDPDRLVQACEAASADRASRVVTSLDLYDAFDAVANAWYANIPIHPNSYRETEHEGLLAVVEYVAAVCLARPRRSSGIDRPGLTGDVVTGWTDDIRDLLHVESVRATITTREGPLADARSAQVGRHLLVRAPGYLWQEQQLSRDLFGAAGVAGDVRAAVGFSVEEAMSIVDWLGRRPIEQMASRMKSVRRIVDVAVAAASGDESGTDIPESLRSFVEKLRTVEGTARRPAAEAYFVAASFATIGRDLAFTAEGLAAEAAVSLEAAGAFLELCSIEFGSLSGMDHLRAMQEVRRRPILADRATAEYLCVASIDLVWAMRPLVEQALKDVGGQAWTRYERLRSRLLEQRAGDLIVAAVRPDHSWSNLTWTEDGEVFELDRLILVDDIAIAVECKAGGFTPAAQRGATDTLRRDLRKLVTDADEQARRVRRRLDSDEIVTFTQSDGTSVEIDASAVRHVHAVIVVLDDLSALVPRIWELVAQGLLPVGDEPPLVLSLHEVDILSDLLDTPSQLVDYMRRRESYNALGIVDAFEELDLVIDYLENGLNWDETLGSGERPDRVSLGSMTDDLDAYYLHRQGIRTAPVPKPAQPIPPRVAALIASLETDRSPGWLRASLSLLDLSGEARQRLDSDLSELVRRAAADGGSHDLSFAIETSSRRGFTIVVGPPNVFESSVEGAQVVAYKNKYMQRAAEWFAVVLVLVEDELDLGAFASDDREWVRDPDLDAMLGYEPGEDDTRPSG